MSKMAATAEVRNRHLLASMEHSICYPLITKLSAGEITLEPLKLVTPEGVSLTLAFHPLYVHTGSGSLHTILDFHIEDLVDCGRPLEIDVSIQRINRGSGTTPSARTSWPAPDPVEKTTLTANGLAGSIQPFNNSTIVTVKVEVYSLPSPVPPIQKGQNEARVHGHLPDVVLTLGDDEFPAHRAVLAAASPVFRKMFYGDCKEAKALNKGPAGDLVCEVPISGVSMDAVELFLTLLYEGEADDWKDLEVELLELSEYYMVSHIKVECESRLMGMDGSTALGILKQAENPVISSEVRVRAVQAVLQGWKRLSITPLWRDLQKASPVLADAIRAAQQLYEPAVKPTQGATTALCGCCIAIGLSLCFLFVLSILIPMACKIALSLIVTSSCD